MLSLPSIKAWLRPAALLLALLSATPGIAAPRPGPLPLVPVAASVTATGPLVIFYSGDGGWAHTDRILSRDLADEGLSVVGLDALHYFWRHRTADAAAADLSAIIRRYSADGPEAGVVLMGYSFGADALPLIMPHLPPEVLARVRLIALVAPGATGELVLRPNSWLNIPGKGAVPISTALAAAPHVEILCVYGERDRRAACPRLGPGVSTLEVPGGHHMKGYESAIARTIAQKAAAH